MQEAEPKACPSRSSLPTIARKEDASSSMMFDDFEVALDEPRLTWAVDLGNEVRALTTFDLWYALNTGAFAADVRVWRLGREAWTKASEVPELSPALRLSFSSIPDGVDERRTMDYTARPPSFEGTMSARRKALVVLDEPLRETLIKTAKPPNVVLDDHAFVGLDEVELFDVASPVSTDLPAFEPTPTPSNSEVRPAKRRRNVKRVLSAALAMAASLAAGIALAATTNTVPADPVGSALVAEPPAIVLAAVPEAGLAGLGPLVEISQEQPSEVAVIDTPQKTPLLPPAKTDEGPRTRAWRAIKSKAKSWSPSHRGQRRERQTTRR